MPAAIILVAMTAFAEQLDLRVGRRTRVSLAGPFLVAAALVGGPLVGAAAGAATELFPTGEPRRRRVVCACAGALQGLAIGVVGDRFVLGGVSGAVVVVAAGLLTGFALNGRLVLRALGRGARLRHELYAPPGDRLRFRGSCRRRSSSRSSTSSRRRRGSRLLLPPGCCCALPGRIDFAFALSGPSRRNARVRASMR